MFRLLIASFFLLPSCQCQKETESKQTETQNETSTSIDQKAPSDFPIQEHLKKEEIQEALKGSKVFKLDLKKGEGADYASGKQVAIKFHAWLKDGSLFDTTDKRSGELRFLSGAGRIIIGLEQGLSGMKVGGERLVVIPPKYAYGRVGIEKRVPPDSHLIYYITFSAME